MKKLTALLTVVLLCVALCSCSGGFVDTIKGYLGQDTEEKPAGYIETKENDLYVYDVFKKYIEITEYKGEEKDVVVPSEIDGKPVKVIGTLCFYRDYSVETLVIPEGVETIENTAFYYCTSLRRVKLPDSCTSYGERLFSWCTSLETITIPAGMTVIPRLAFNNCTSLSEIVWNDKITDIGVRAFSWCTSLTEIALPESVLTVDDYAFYNCGTLQSVTIPTHTVYSANAFEKCDNATLSGGIVKTEDEVSDVSSEISEPIAEESDASASISE